MRQKVKCLVWDLDNTLWNGVLLEDGEVTLRDGAVDLIHTLDERGILQSIASRNDYDLAMAALEALGLKEYFIYPQINWNAKSTSIKIIAEQINIDIETLAFIDDQPFEREEVAYTYPNVLCIDAANLENVSHMPVMIPQFVTQDSRHRRQMYQSAIQRKQVEDNYEGIQEDFLASLRMKLTISTAKEEDLRRAEELTVRTNQLNTTGYTYSYDELYDFHKSDRHHLWVAGLEDIYGTYGKIGLALIEIERQEWWIRLLLMSCRVMNRGVGTVLINHIRNQARKAGVRLLAEMIPNDRNRMMFMTYKFTHFREVSQTGDRIIFANDLEHEQAFPHYLKIDLH